jgi:hypothetical protein
MSFSVSGLVLNWPAIKGEGMINAAEEDRISGESTGATSHPG